MSSYTFALKSNWFASDNYSVEKTCLDCGAVFTVDKRNITKKNYCDSCTYQRKTDNDRQRERKTEANKENIFFRDSGIDLSYAVINQAILDARNGDAEARQFLRADDGAILYLKCAGITVTDEMRERLYWIGKKRTHKTRQNVR